AVRGIAGDEIKLPQEAAVVRVVSAHETAYAEVRPAVADDDLAVEHPGRARDRVRPLVAERLHRPAGLAGLRVKGDQTAVERRDDDAVLPRRKPARDRLAAREPAPLSRHLGIVAPQQLASLRVVRIGDVPRA